MPPGAGDEPEAIAHVGQRDDDARPGISRRRAGTGFAYRGPDGQPIRDRAELNRIRKLAVPPAWNAVAFSPLATDPIQGTFNKSVPYQPDADVAAKSVSDFSTVIPAFADPGLETLLAAHGGIINARPLDQPANPFLTIVLGFGPTLLLIGGFVWLSRRAARQMGGGIFGLGKSQAKRYDETRSASPSVLRPLRQALEGATGRRVADIGGGTGNYAVARKRDLDQLEHLDRVLQSIARVAGVITARRVRAWQAR